MIRIGARILLLGLTVAGAIVEKLEDGRSEQSNVKLSTLLQLKPEESELREELLSGQRNWILFQEMKNQFNLELKILLEEAKSCRKNYLNLTDQMFNLKLYGFLLQKLVGTPNGSSAFNCDINNEVADDLRKKLQQLEDFQKNFAFFPKTNSSEFREAEINAQEELKSHLLTHMEGELENDLRLNLEDEWKTKIPHVSHIYLGRSLFPLMTEESRVIDKHHTTRSSGITRRPSARATNTRTKPDPHNFATVYQLLTPFRWIKNSKAQDNETRIARSLDDEDNEDDEDARLFDSSTVSTRGKYDSDGSPISEAKFPLLVSTDNGGLLTAISFLSSSLYRELKTTFNNNFRKNLNRTRRRTTNNLIGKLDKFWKNLCNT